MPRALARTFAWPPGTSPSSGKVVGVGGFAQQPVDHLVDGAVTAEHGHQSDTFDHGSGSELGGVAARLRRDDLEVELVTQGRGDGAAGAFVRARRVRVDDQERAHPLRLGSPGAAVVAHPGAERLQRPSPEIAPALADCC